MLLLTSAIPLQSSLLARVCVIRRRRRIMFNEHFSLPQEGHAHAPLSLCESWVDPSASVATESGKRVAAFDSRVSLFTVLVDLIHPFPTPRTYGLFVHAHFFSLRPSYSFCRAFLPSISLLSSSRLPPSHTNVAGMYPPRNSSSWSVSSEFGLVLSAVRTKVKAEERRGSAVEIPFGLKCQVCVCACVCLHVCSRFTSFAL